MKKRDVYRHVLKTTTTTKTKTQVVCVKQKSSISALKYNVLCTFIMPTIQASGTSLGRSAVILMIHHHVHLLFFQLQHFIEGVQEFVKLIRLLLLLSFHLVDSALDTNNHTAADDDLQNEDEEEGEGPLGDGQVFKIVVFLP